MTNTEIGSTVSILSEPVVNESYSIALDLARDILKSDFDDYMFFYNGHGTLSASQSYDQFILLRCSELSRNGVAYVCDTVLVSQIYVISETVSSSSSVSFSGTELQLDDSPISRFSGSGSVTSNDIRYYTALYTYDREQVTVTSFVTNVIYSSLPNEPKLVEGVHYYAALQNVLLCASFAFILADKLFKRVY